MHRHGTANEHLLTALSTTTTKAALVLHLLLRLLLKLLLMSLLALFIWLLLSGIADRLLKICRLLLLVVICRNHIVAVLLIRLLLLLLSSVADVAVSRILSIVGVSSTPIIGLIPAILVLVRIKA